MSGFLAVDWGTTNRRVHVIDDGVVVATERDALGVTAIAADDWPAAIAALRQRHGDRPMLLAGMVGSTIGWRVAPYAPVPADLAALAGHVLRIDDRTVIVPGVAWSDGTRGDVMRGEEVQFMGAVAAGLAPADALLCQPGTHCKWATMAGGAIAGFTTAMTGELFALLSRHGVLAPQLGGVVSADAAFRDGVVEGARGDLAASLFGIRAAGVLGLRADADAAAYASGLLIGADVARRLERGGPVYVLADAALGALYLAAIETLDGGAVLVDSHAAFVAGAIALERLIR